VDEETEATECKNSSHHSDSESVTLLQPDTSNPVQTQWLHDGWAGLPQSCSFTNSSLVCSLKCFMVPCLHSSRKGEGEEPLGRNLVSGTFDYHFCLNFIGQEVVMWSHDHTKLQARCVYMCVCVCVCHVCVPVYISCMCVYVCVCMCIYVYMCVCVYMCICVYICVNMCARVCMCVYMWVYMCTCEYVCTCTSVYMCVYVCTCVYVCVHVHVCICVYMYVYTCMFLWKQKYDGSHVFSSVLEVFLLPSFTNCSSLILSLSHTTPLIFSHQLLALRHCDRLSMALPFTSSADCILQEGLGGSLRTWS